MKVTGTVVKSGLRDFTKRNGQPGQEIKLQVVDESVDGVLSLSKSAAARDVVPQKGQTLEAVIKWINTVDAKPPFTVFVAESWEVV